MHTTERQLQQNLDNIQDWATKYGFKFSKSKTVCMHFCQLMILYLLWMEHLSQW